MAKTKDEIKIEELKRENVQLKDTVGTLEAANNVVGENIKKIEEENKVLKVELKKLQKELGIKIEAKEDTVNIVKDGRVIRFYSKKMHGEDYLKMANGFAKKKEAQVVEVTRSRICR